MGYEIKLYLGEVTDLNGKNKYFSVTGMIDLRKPGYDSKIHTLQNSIDKSKIIEGVYFYGTDGDTQITEDKCGSQLVAIPAKDVLKAVEEDWENTKRDWNSNIGYRRFYMAIYLLYSFVKSFKNPYVILYR